MNPTKFVLFFLAWAAATALLAEVALPDGGTAVVEHPDSTLVFVIEAGSRLYQGWTEEHEVGFGERFWLSDTDMTGTVAEFMPDFKIKDGKPVNWSSEMNNPAVRVVVEGDTTVAESSWAFLNFPPHFSAQVFWTFQLKEVRSGDDVLATTLPEAQLSDEKSGEH